ncbi:MAG TPA: hypothetical protein DC053_15540 [Lachnoclostridium sp.]|nr:hypothetical protein [Lachnoclostridium sp.]
MRWDMSVKGISQTMYVRKAEASIITYWGNKKLVLYDDLKQIDYMYAMKRESGFINFMNKDNHITQFKFNIKANEKILKTVKLIKENYPDITMNEKHVEDLKLYERWWITKRTGLILITLIILLFGFSGIYTVYSRYSDAAIDNVNLSNRLDESLNEDYVSINESENMSLVSEKTEAYSTTLTAGHYLVGTDLPVGTYNFYSKKGSGNLISSDGTVNVIFDHNNESGKSIGIDNFGTEEINNIYLSEGVSLTVTGAQEISAGCDDGLVDSMKERDQEGLKEIEVGYGQYGASDNIPSGTYDIEWIEGNGNIICSSSIDSGINEIMGEPTDESAINNSLIKKFRNLTINEGDILEVDKIKVKLIPSK